MAETIHTKKANKKRRTARILWAVTVTLWGLLTLGIIAEIRTKNDIPVDASTYYIALEKFKEGKSPYQDPAENRTIWEAIHQLEARVLDGTLDELPEDELPGPYIYPPTLLQALHLLHITPSLFMILLVTHLLLFCWLWLKVSDASAWWLILVLFSWDVVGSFSLGNIEIILLAYVLAASWLLYRGRPLTAAPFIAFTMAVKPFYGLFFASMGLLLIAGGGQRTGRVRDLALGAAGAVGLLLLSAALWPGWLRPAVMDYLREGLAHSWYILPAVEQSPMSIWNRTFMQGLVNLGIPAGTAQAATLPVWGMIAGLTATRLWNRRVTFPMLFAFCLVLFYWFRPVGWSFIYLDMVVLTAVWPVTSRRARTALLAGAISLALSHWVAVSLTDQMVWMRLVTLQSAEFPWETWLVFPLCWGVLLWGSGRGQQSG